MVKLAFKAMQQNGSLWPTMKVCKYLKNKNQPKVTSFSAKLQAGRESKLVSCLSTLYGQQVNLARVLWYITAVHWLHSLCKVVCLRQECNIPVPPQSGHGQVEVPYFRTSPPLVWSSCASRSSAEWPSSLYFCMCGTGDNWEGLLMGHVEIIYKTISKRENLK